MSHRPKPTLMDYMVVGISPALIMAMVGSLLFYLLLVFYHGQYGGRLNFIFAMFVMAIVLIGRISMERGIEYASLFALPLGLVTMMAMARFVRISGPLAEFSLLINFGLIALVYQCLLQSLALSLLGPSLSLSIVLLVFTLVIALTTFALYEVTTKTH